MWSWLSPIAPVYLGWFYLRPHADWQSGLLGIFASVVLIASAILCAKRTRLSLVVAAHFALIFYWVVGFLLIAAGV